MKSVVIIGAGMTGVLTALSLAETGHKVFLIDKSSEVLKAASYVNEGKLHLGYVYGGDMSLRTADKMIQGASSFFDEICKWINTSEIEENLSSPFIYAVHHASQQEHISDYFHLVSKRLLENKAKFPAKFFGKDIDYLEKLNSNRLAQLFDTELVTSAYYTAERSVDVKWIAKCLRANVKLHPNIQLLLDTEVLRIGVGETPYVDICIGSDQLERLSGSKVINCSWQNRLALDATFCAPVKRPVIHRYKTALNFLDVEKSEHIKSVTFVHGCFGDTVQFKNRTYLSWYPTGLLYQEEILQPRFDESIMGKNENQIACTALSELNRLMPSIAALQSTYQRTPHRFHVEGGYISAWGKTGIDDDKSELHNRFDIGVTSHPYGLSVDTGKYSLAPLVAKQSIDLLTGNTVP